MNAQLPDDDVLLDLLAKRATEGLTRDEEAQLNALLATHPGVPADAFEGAVATLTSAAKPRESMPAALRARVLAQAQAANATASAPAPASVASVTPLAPRSRASSSGWWAAAACLVLAVAGWWPRLVSTPGLPPAAPADAAEAREALAARQNVLRVQLAAGPGATDAPLAGDVVFDPVTQTGYLRFRGIPANDPRLAQYQLWIADGARAQPEPVDGGVFDVPSAAANGDVIIPFRAKLQVGSAAAFVITQEQPGGVVVSRQERVLALGRVDSGA
jgi:hypothetical protein